jgi:hypothetical protein
VREADTGRRPDFYVVGAPKCGTTSLYQYLRQHPQVFMPDRKEPHYFTDAHQLPSSYPRMDVHEYLALFAGALEDQIAGEASVTYLTSTGAAARMQEFTPAARIVVPLRNPVDRAYSEYWNSRRAGMQHLSFADAIAEESQRDPWRRYVGKGYYAQHVGRFIEAFGADAVHVCFFDDLVADPRLLCRGVFSFLGVDPSVEVDTSTVYNRGGAPRWRSAGVLHTAIARRAQPVRRAMEAVLPTRLTLALRRGFRRLMIRADVPPMQADTRRHLQQLYAADIEQLQRITGTSLAHWLV